jgi:hypothetical protein
MEGAHSNRIPVALLRKFILLKNVASNPRCMTWTEALLYKRRQNLNYQTAPLSDTIPNFYWAFHFCVVVNKITTPPIKIISACYLKHKRSCSLDCNNIVAQHVLSLVLIFWYGLTKWLLVSLIPCATTYRFTLWPKQWTQSCPISTVNLLLDARRTNPGLAIGHRIIV